MAIVFFSYSHVDEALRDQLEMHLSLLKRQGHVEAWHDRRILAGDELDPAIKENLENADVILLLVSANFIGSDYCYSKEMERAIERHNAGEARVVPVILRPCDWHSAPFGKLMATPKDGKAITMWANPDEAFTDVVRQVRTAVEGMNARSANVGVCSGKSSAPAVAVSQPGASSILAGPNPADDAPRSSNLRLTKEFSDLERDEFIQASFDYMGRFFESSLAELATRHPDIDGRYRRIDARRFTAIIYRDVKAVSQCAIRIDSIGSRSQHIAFSYNASASDGSSNEMLQVEFDSQAMYFKSLGMQSTGGRNPGRLAEQGAAELLWDLLIAPLQR
ncbi:toll/interleukin-1 receptor domain-containing protein [Massilia sp. TWR1-2-2]|uniref:toll/interleukin-1 receptor domain-containing protein n=1 Tax=Massilia sp. TWR1-2-2 TaxID=2804584 RepID=UPI003CEF1C0C